MSRPTSTDSDYRAAADTATPLEQLAALAVDHPELQETIALNPATYPGLLTWLAQFGTPAAQFAVRTWRGLAAADSGSEVPPTPEYAALSAPDHAPGYVHPEAAPPAVAVRSATQKSDPGRGIDVWLWVALLVGGAASVFNPQLVVEVFVCGVAIAAGVSLVTIAFRRHPRDVPARVFALVWLACGLSSAVLGLIVGTSLGSYGYNVAGSSVAVTLVGVLQGLAAWPPVTLYALVYYLAMVIVAIVRWARHRPQAQAKRARRAAFRAEQHQQYAPAGSRVQPAVWAPMSGMAVASFVLGLLGGSVVGLVLGIVALNQTQRTGERGRGLAIAGVVLSSLWIVAAIVYVIILLGVLGSVG